MFSDVTAEFDMPETNMTFESAMEELDQLVQKMEGQNLNLQEALAHFERGITLTRFCQDALQNAEQKVKVLSDSLDSPQDD